MIQHFLRNAFAVAVLLTAGAAYATGSPIIVPITARQGLVQTGAGTGLSGKFYDQNISDPVAAHATIGNSPANGTFKATTIDYCCGDDSQSVISFLKTDGASFVGSDPGNFTGSVLTFDGYINITKSMDTDLATSAIQVLFALSSDDGFDFKIGGVSLGSTGARSYGTSYYPVEFSAAGLYSFSLLYYENSGSNGLNLSAYSPADQNQKTLAASNFFSSVPSGSRIPEPGMIGMLGLGALGVAGWRRRR